ncbi:MAG: hypothetical protein H6837_18065 [Planctomycetes bacterium]|nr:hypothetical protein [Planctomycetota bacterium]
MRIAACATAKNPSLRYRVMESILVFAWAGPLILLGAGQLSWIVYNLFIEMQPAAEGRSPVLPTAIGVGLISLGVFRLRTQIQKAGRVRGYETTQPTDPGGA